MKNRQKAVYSKKKNKMKKKENPKMQSLVSAPTWSPLEKLCRCLTSLRGNLEGWGKLPGKKKTRRLKREENCASGQLLRWAWVFPTWMHEGLQPVGSSFHKLTAMSAETFSLKRREERGRRTSKLAKEGHLLSEPQLWTQDLPLLGSNVNRSVQKTPTAKQKNSLESMKMKKIEVSYFKIVLPYAIAS